MAFGIDGAPRINLFALVVYIPDPLAGFLDDLRKELVADCLPRAHVTILPPRPLQAGQAGTDAAIEQARTVAGGFAPFDIATGEVEIFPTTDVIYIGIQSGERELREMYRALNHGPLAFREPFSYHPHITLAQGLPPDRERNVRVVGKRLAESERTMVEGPVHLAELAFATLDADVDDVCGRENLNFAGCNIEWREPTGNRPRLLDRGIGPRLSRLERPWRQDGHVSARQAISHQLFSQVVE